MQNDNTTSELNFSDNFIEKKIINLGASIINKSTENYNPDVSRNQYLVNLKDFDDK